MTFYIAKDSGPWRSCSQYKTVAASQTTAQISTGTNSVGDYLDSIVVVPGTTGSAACSLLDGSTVVMAIPAAVTGATSIAPYSISLGMVATSTKGWVITTGANTAIIAIGQFDNDGI